ncbi:MAG: phosphoribosylanthranilate isomerase [Pseudomonadota bacterium]
MTVTRHRLTRVKICGITCAEDALAAVAAGADAIGLVFYAPSPRAVSAEQAAAIVETLPPFVTTVGLFVNAAADEVADVLERVPLDRLQFHGDEEAAFCASFARPWIKAVRMAEGVELERVAQQYRGAGALLLDSYRKGVHGGTGHTFDWARIPPGLRMPIILAGGLGPQNVTEAIRQVHPYAVDVSSGVELEKGIKDADKITAFMRGVEIADGD